MTSEFAALEYQNTIQLMYMLSHLPDESEMIHFVQLCILWHVNIEQSLAFPFWTIRLTPKCDFLTYNRIEES